jgi:hypothetical protein
MTTNKPSVITERLIRESLELHHLMKAAEEVKDLPSPATPIEKNAKGVADPTPSIALDPRRIGVGDAVRQAEGSLSELIDRVQALQTELAVALDTWQGK